MAEQIRFSKLHWCFFVICYLISLRIRCYKNNCKEIQLNFSNVFLPVTFMNSAYLAIPVNNLILGEQALGISIIYNFFY